MEKPWTRAVDVGGNGIRRADVSKTRVENIKTIPVQDLKGKSQLETLSALTNFAREGASEAEGIAFSLPGVIEENDFVAASPNAHFLEGVRLGQRTKNETEKKSAVFNDMETAITGIALLLKKPYFMAMTISSGIGERVWKDGQIICPAEGGHMILDPSPFAPLCGDGKRGHAEAIISGDAIARRVIAETQIRGITLPQQHPCAFLDQAYDKGELWAVEIYNIFAYGMGIFLANIQSLFCLPLIVFKGKFAEKGFWRVSHLVRKTMIENMINPSWAQENRLKFFPTPAQNNADAFIGAAECLKRV